MSKKSTKRPWRSLLKKQQRKRKRQKLAQERDIKLEKEELSKLNDPLYKEQLEQQAQLEQLQEQIAAEKHNECEEEWLRRELLAQKHFRREEQKRIAKEKLEEELRQQQEQRLKEHEESLRRKREAIRKESEQAAKDFEESMQLMESYLEDTSVATPTRLQKCLETRPGEKLCEFYDRTNCCRFGLVCVYNHQMPVLARVILIKHFFQHTVLDNRRHQEYSSADEHLEVSEHEFQKDYEEFCTDVWPEMESFGVVVNFRTVRNKLSHLKGHVFVEFADKRSALKAFIKLQNRYYASKPLKVEFSHITYWRSAVCGMIVFKGLSLARKCPKGDNCNYLHLMHNPGNKYNTPLEALGNVRSSCRSVAVPLPTTLNWNDVVALEGANKTNRWRWSESPEIEIKSSAEQTKIPAAYTKCPNESKSYNLNMSVGSRDLSAKRSHKSSSEIDPHKTLEYSKNTSVNNDNIGRKTNHKLCKQRPPEDKRKTKHKSSKKSSSKVKHKKKHKTRDHSPSVKTYKSEHKSRKQSPAEEKHKISRSARSSSTERHKREKDYSGNRRDRSHSHEHSRKR